MTIISLESQPIPLDHPLRGEPAGPISPSKAVNHPAALPTTPAAQQLPGDFSRMSSVGGGLFPIELLSQWGS